MASSEMTGAANVGTAGVSGSSTDGRDPPKPEPMPGTPTKPQPATAIATTNEDDPAPAGHPGSLRQRWRAWFNFSPSVMPKPPPFFASFR